jgi:hypothetical protein
MNSKNTFSGRIAFKKEAVIVVMSLKLNINSAENYQHQ